MSLSANLSLEIQASQLWHMLKKQQRCDYGMEERCQLLNDPLIYWWKRMRCQNKSGNRLEYIKWCVVSGQLEPILPVSLRLGCLRISVRELIPEGGLGCFTWLCLWFLKNVNEAVWAKKNHLLFKMWIWGSNGKKGFVTFSVVTAVEFLCCYGVLMCFSFFLWEGLHSVFY